MTRRTGDRFGPYRLLELLGRGGMGEVYRAHDLEKDRIVAVKLLPAHLAEDHSYQVRFEREAQTAASVTDPHVVPIHTYGRIEGVLFLEMPLVAGEDLRSIIQREGALPAQRAVAIIEQVASALDAAHAVGLTHRDVKPENILITQDDFCYLADFGIASRADDTRLTEEISVVGSLRYMAPERFGDAPATPAADTYGLACIAHELLTGRQAFASRSVASLTPEQLGDYPPPPACVPEPMAAALRAALDKDPPMRPASSGELARRLREGLPQPAARRRLAPRHWAAAVVAFLLTVAVSSALGAWVLGDDAETVVLMPADQTSARAFTRSVLTQPAGETVRQPAVRRDGVRPVSGRTPSAAALLSATEGERGDAPGLYGVPGANRPPCDAAALVQMITSDPTRAAVWADLLSTTPERIRATVAALTPLILRSDTLVVNSDYAQRAIQYPAVLQAGTAVLVDRDGIPRVKCNCGNPLAEAPREVPTAVSGRAWSGWRGTAVRVARADPAIHRFAAVRITTGERVSVPAGAAAPAPSVAESTTSTTPSASSTASTASEPEPTSTRTAPSAASGDAAAPSRNPAAPTRTPAPPTHPPAPPTHPPPPSTPDPPTTSRPPWTLTTEPPTSTRSLPPRTLATEPPTETRPAPTTAPTQTPRTLVGVPTTTGPPLI